MHLYLAVDLLPLCCSVMQRVAAYCRALHRTAACCSVLQRVAVCSSVPQCVLTFEIVYLAVDAFDGALSIGVQCVFKSCYTSAL